MSIILNGNPIDQLTLKQSTIDQLKKSIAKRENILEEDVTDSMVFEFIGDLEEMEDGIITDGSNKVDDWRFIEPRNVFQIIDDLLFESNDDSYLAFI